MEIKRQRKKSHDLVDTLDGEEWLMWTVEPTERIGIQSCHESKMIKAAILHKGLQTFHFHLYLNHEIQIHHFLVGCVIKLYPNIQSDAGTL